MNPRRAFTLLEVTLAVALGATLMVALLHLTVSLQSAQSRFDDEGATAPWMTRIASLIRDDLEHAEAVWERDDALSILTRSSVGLGTGGVHAPCIVTYRVEEEGGGAAMLFRRQVSLIHAPNDRHRERSDRLCEYVSAFEWAQNAPSIAAGSPRGETGTDGISPRRLRVDLRTAGPTGSHAATVTAHIPWCIAGQRADEESR